MRESEALNHDRNEPGRKASNSAKTSELVCAAGEETALVYLRV